MFALKLLAPMYVAGFNQLIPAAAVHILFVISKRDNWSIEYVISCNYLYWEMIFDIRTLMLNTYNVRICMYFWNMCKLFVVKKRRDWDERMWLHTMCLIWCSNNKTDLYNLITSSSQMMNVSETRRYLQFRGFDGC